MQKLFVCPACRPKGDVYDWLKAGHSMEEVDDLPYLDILEQDESTELKSEPQKENRVKIKHKKILYWKFSKSKVQHCLSTAKIMSRTLRLDKISI